MENQQNQQLFSALNHQCYQGYLKAHQAFFNPSLMLIQQEIEPYQFNNQQTAQFPVITELISNLPVISQELLFSQPKIAQQQKKEQNFCQIAQQAGQISLSQECQKAQNLETQVQVDLDQDVQIDFSSREDDSNNAHKKIITCLSKSLTKPQSILLKTSTKNLKTIYNIDVEIKKPSRYGFINKLSCIKFLLGQGELLSIFERFKENIQQYQNIMSGDKPSQYLKMLPKFYIESFEHFINGEIGMAVSTIYKLGQKFKQQAYLRRGVRKAVEFYELLKNIE